VHILVDIDDLDALAEQIHDLREALRPFSAAWYNDNGEVEINTSHLSQDHWRDAAEALRKHQKDKVIWYGQKT